MTATYRLIHFVPDPFTGMRFPLGAIVAESGNVRVTKVAKLPSASCLGDHTLALAIQRLHGRLDAIASADALPAVFGPYASLTEPKEVPQGVTDAFSWVEGLINPPRLEMKQVVTPRNCAARGLEAYLRGIK